MADSKRMKEAMAELAPILRQISDFQEKYSDVLKEFNSKKGPMTDEERNDAAIEILNKYSNL